jgi:hypothetical protein
VEAAPVRSLGRVNGSRRQGTGQARAFLPRTVEEIAEAEIDKAYSALAGRGLPAIRGEVIEGDVAGYHYYPGRERVRHWLDAGALEIVEEDTEPQQGWAYWHLLLRSR